MSSGLRGPFRARVFVALSARRAAVERPRPAAMCLDVEASSRRQKTALMLNCLSALKRRTAVRHSVSGSQRGGKPAKFPVRRALCRTESVCVTNSLPASFVRLKRSSPASSRFILAPRRYASVAPGRSVDDRATIGLGCVGRCGHCSLGTFNACRADDEPIRRRPDEVERIARHERKRGGRSRTDDADFGRIHDEERRHTVMSARLGRVEHDVVADLDVPQRPKKRVSMAGYCDVPKLARQRRGFDMSEAEA